MADALYCRNCGLRRQAGPATSLCSIELSIDPFIYLPIYISMGLDSALVIGFRVQRVLQITNWDVHCVEDPCLESSHI